MSGASAPSVSTLLPVQSSSSANASSNLGIRVESRSQPTSSSNTNGGSEQQQQQPLQAEPPRQQPQTNEPNLDNFYQALFTSGNPSDQTYVVPSSINSSIQIQPSKRPITSNPSQNEDSELPAKRPKVPTQVAVSSSSTTTTAAKMNPSAPVILPIEIGSSLNENVGGGSAQMIVSGQTNPNGGDTIANSNSSASIITTTAVTNGSEFDNNGSNNNDDDDDDGIENEDDLLTKLSSNDNNNVINSSNNINKSIIEADHARNANLQIERSNVNQVAPASVQEQKYMEITDYLTMPQSTAALKLGFPPSTFSKRWREAACGRKWPYRTVSKIDKEILTLLHNIPQGSNSSNLPEEMENTLALLLKKRQEELKPVFIRI